MEYSYLICFSIDPVKFGFTCRNLSDHKEFKGFNAFNRYFHELEPNTKAKDITDVWDGYYRITLAQFDSRDRPEQLRKKLESFRPTISNSQMQQPLFTTRKLSLATNHFRLGQDFANEPVALYITHPSEFVFDPVLQEMKNQINPVEWSKIPKRLLHMNIRLYSDAGERYWTWKEIQQHGIPTKVSSHVIEFHHTTLQIIPSRDTCQKAYNRESDEPWWEGVTELAGRCSDCKNSVGENEWNGVCSRCKQYERIKPVWSIPYSTTVTNFLRKRLFSYHECVSDSEFVEILS